MWKLPNTYHRHILYFYAADVFQCQVFYLMLVLKKMLSNWSLVCQTCFFLCFACYLSQTFKAQGLSLPFL